VLHPNIDDRKSPAASFWMDERLDASTGLPVARHPETNWENDLHEVY